MAVFDPERKRTARGAARQKELLCAAGRVFAREGYHQATTNAIAAEAGVSPATLYQFFPNKEALANALTAQLAREMAEAERAIDAAYVLPLAEAVARLLEGGLRFHQQHPEFHTLLLEAPLHADTRQEKEELAGVFIGFIADRLCRERPQMSAAEARHHAEMALTIFKGVLTEVAHAKSVDKARWKQGLKDAVLRYLVPVAGSGQ